MECNYRTVRIRKTQLERIHCIGEENAMKNVEVIDLLLDMYDKRNEAESNDDKRLKRIERMLTVYTTAVTEVLLRNNIDITEIATHDKEGDS
jgi:uncharacterized protein (UPF0305 family)